MYAITNRDLHKFLTTKLRFFCIGGSNHDQYDLRQGQAVSIPTRPSIPRHSGDLSCTVLKKTAAALGISPKGLASGCKCHLSDSCIYFCLAGHIINRGASIRLPTSDAIKISSQIFETVQHLIDLSSPLPPTWNSFEAQELEEAESSFVLPHKGNAVVDDAIGIWLSSVCLIP